MAKRKFIDVARYEGYCNLKVSYDDGNHILEEYPIPISETKIVKPYLEKLKSQITEYEKPEHIPEDVEMWDYISGMDKVVALIDSMLSDMKEE